MPMDLRQFLSNIAKYLGIMKTEPEDIEMAMILGYKSTGEPVIISDSDGYPQFSIKKFLDGLSTSHTPSDNAVATITVTAGQIWEVLAIFATFTVDGTALDRTAQLQIAPGMTNILSAIPAQHWVQTDTLTLSASQEGSIWMVGRNYIFFNDNGIITKSTSASDSILPLILGPEGAVKAAIVTNKQTGDRQCIAILYRRLA